MISAARQGDQHACPLPGHGATPIVTSSGNTTINGMGAARVGDICGCGAVIVAGFPSIIINGRPKAHLGSPTSHGGTIISGSPDVGGGMTFGGSATSVVIDFSRLGLIAPDGSLDEQRLNALLADPGLHDKARAAGALVTPGTPPAVREPTCNHPDQMLDLATYIAGEMNRNLLHPTVLKIKQLLSYDTAEQTRKWMELPWYAQIGTHNNPQTIAVANTAAAMAMWAEKVGQTREWDHKPKIQTLFKDVRHKQGRHTYFYDIWSNIHYGYIGLAAGFSESMLLDGAGLEQIASETLAKVKEFGKYDWPKPTEGIDGLRAWDDDPDRISIGIGIRLYGRYPKGGIQASVVMNEVLQITPDEWGDAVRLHTCFEEAGKSTKDKTRYNDSQHSEKS